MGRALGFIVLLAALYIGMQIYTEGIDSLLTRATAPIEGTRREAPLATGLSDAAGLADTMPTDRTRRVWVTEAVREKVTADIARGADRHSR